MKMLEPISDKLHAYAAKGHKGNRSQQVARIHAFAQHAYNLGARSLGQVGATHVIRYWKANRHRTDGTLYNHWLALCLLWEMSGKPGTPPEPRYQTRHKKGQKQREK